MLTRELTRRRYGNALHYGLSMLNWEKIYCKGCGNALHYGLSMFVEFEKLPGPSVTSISVIFNVLLHITKFYKHE